MNLCIAVTLEQNNSGCNKEVHGLLTKVETHAMETVEASDYIPDYRVT